MKHRKGDEIPFESAAYQCGFFNTKNRFAPTRAQERKIKMEEENDVIQTEEVEEPQAGQPEPEEEGDVFAEPEDFSEASEEIKEEAAVAEESKLYRLKHNKQEVELTEDQLLEAASKGLDYDRIREDRDRIRSGREFATLDSLARRAGMSREAYVDMLQMRQTGQAMESRRAELVGRGMDESTAAHVARVEAENNELKGTRKTPMDELNERVQRDVSAFSEKFPEVDRLPDDVVAAVRGGENPLVAYMDYRIREMDMELKALKQGQKNRQGAAGPVKTLSASEEDPFLQGFLGR